MDIKLLKQICNIVTCMLLFTTLSNKDDVAGGQITTVPVQE